MKESLNNAGYVAGLLSNKCECNLNKTIIILGIAVSVVLIINYLTLDAELRIINRMYIKQEQNSD